MTHVLRLGVDDDVRVFDGRGREWIGRVASVGKAGVTVEMFREVKPVAEPAVRVTLAVAVLKGDHMDGVVRDATMLGVTEIVPISSEHVTVPDRAWQSGVAVERWQRIAVASAKQCGRAVVPAIAPVSPLEAILANRPVDVRLMCVEPDHAGAKKVAVTVASPPQTALALVGPEGGWTIAEIELAARHGARLVHLGPRTLRAETAPTVLLSALWTVWGW